MPRVIVVGGGLIGTLHAVEAQRRGWDVVHYDIDPEPQYASVRHVGALRVGDRAEGDELDLALRGRARWRELAAAAPGIGLRTDGSLTVATDDRAAATLAGRAACPTAARRGLQLLGPDAARRVEPALGDGVVAALRCTLDATVEPRVALAALRRLALAGDGYRFVGGRQVWEVGPGRTVDTAGRVEVADLVLVCTGARPSVLSNMLTARAPLRRIRLQLLQTARVLRPPRGPILDARRPDPLAGEADVELSLTPRPNGGLTVGRVAEHEEPFAFDLPERPLDLLRSRVAELLGAPPPALVTRWELLLQTCTDGRLWYREPVDEGVLLVSGAGEHGAVLAPAIAEDTFDWLDGGCGSPGARPAAAR